MITVAVIGVGSMGKNHVRVYQQIPDVELVAVVDHDAATATRVGAQAHVAAYTDVLEMLVRERPLAVSVVVPTVFHFPVVKMALEFGCHVLVEKPIAARMDEAAELNRIADQVNRVLAVGQIERFNPAVIELKRRLDGGELGRIFQIHTRRLGPFPTRVQDVGVIMDLATHDVDIMRFLVGSKVSRLFAETNREVHASSEDLFMGILRFTNRVLGLLEINWLTPTKIRELFVTGERGMFKVDYLTQDLWFFENAEVVGSSWHAPSLLPGVREGSITQYPIQKKEPLLAELEAFVARAQGFQASIVDGADATAALNLVLNLIDSANIGGVREVIPYGPGGSPRPEPATRTRTPQPSTLSVIQAHT